MKTNQMRAFLAVVEQRSIRGAARKLGLTQPAITSAMRELESDLGVTLLERSVAGVSCTAYGDAFAQRARLILSEMRRAREQLEQIQKGDIGQVSVAFSTAIAHTLLPRTFKQFREVAPAVAIRLCEASLPTSYAMLRDGSVDLIISHMMEGSHDEFDVTPLYATSPFVAISDTHPSLHCTRLSDLIDMEWLMPFDSETAPELVHRFFGVLNIRVPDRIVQCTSTAMGLRLVGTQDLVGWFVDSLPEAEFRHYGVRQMAIEDPLPKFKVCILTRPDSVLTPAAQRLFDCVQQQASQFTVPG